MVTRTLSYVGIWLVVSIGDSLCISIVASCLDYYVLLPLVIESIGPFQLITSENQFQKTQKKFRKLILKIIFLHNQSRYQKLY